MARIKPNLLELLFLRYAGDVRRFARRRLNPQDADDLVQDAYLRLLRRGELESLQNPAAFLHTTAAHLAADHFDKADVRARYHETEIDLGALATPTPGPESTVNDQEQLEQIWSALAGLPDLCRYAFLLNRIDGYTHAEIAQRLSISERTVERYILRAVACCHAAFSLTSDD